MLLNKMEMIINKKRRLKFVLMVSLLTIMLISLINAIGVGSPYSSEMPLEMYPGEEETVYLNLYNFDIEDEITLEGKILGGSEIASLDKNTFDVPYNTSNLYAKLTVKVPEEANIGQKYNVNYEFKQIAGGEGVGGMVSFGQGITRNFDVIVIKKPEETPEGISPTWWILGIIAVIAIIAIIWFVVKSKEN